MIECAKDLCFHYLLCLNKYNFFPHLNFIAATRMVECITSFLSILVAIICFKISIFEVPWISYDILFGAAW